MACCTPDAGGEGRGDPRPRAQVSRLNTSPPARVPRAVRARSEVESLRNRTLPSRNAKLTPPVCRLLKPIRCRVSDLGFGITGLKGTAVEPLNRLWPFWA